MLIVLLLLTFVFVCLFVFLVKHNRWFCFWMCNKGALSYFGTLNKGKVNLQGLLNSIIERQTISTLDFFCPPF